MPSWRSRWKRRRRGYKHALRNSAVTPDRDRGGGGPSCARRACICAGRSAKSGVRFERTNALSTDQRMAMRLAASQALKEAIGVGDFAYHAAGATAISRAIPSSGGFRDLHAVAQQIQARRSHFETVGKYLLDVDYDMTFL